MYESTLDEICTEAKRLGIGVISASNPSNYDTWEEHVEAVRNEPEPERLNNFLAQQVSMEFCEKIIKLFK